MGGLFAIPKNGKEQHFRQYWRAKARKTRSLEHAAQKRQKKSDSPPNGIPIHVRSKAEQLRSTAT